MGKLTFVRQTRDTITNITVGLNCLVAEPRRIRATRRLHLVSVFGGDQDIGAVMAAAHEGFDFRSASESTSSRHARRKARDLQGVAADSGRKRPVRHAVLLSKAFFETTLGANSEARRTVLFDDTSEFILHRLAVRFGLPVLPEWAEWFRCRAGAATDGRGPHGSELQSDRSERNETTVCFVSLVKACAERQFKSRQLHLPISSRLDFNFKRNDFMAAPSSIADYFRIYGSSPRRKCSLGFLPLQQLLLPLSPALAS